MTAQQWNPGKLLEVSGSYRKACVLHAAVKVDLFTALGDEKLSSEDIAQKLNADKRALSMLLNALAAMNLLSKVGDKYSNSSASISFLSKDSPDYMATWKKASEDFSKSFKDYLLLMGVVPKDKHLTLVKKYEQLKEKVASQEETIKHLRMLLNAKKAQAQAQAQGDITKEFQDLIEKQGEQFQETMETFGRLFKKDENQS